MKALGAIATVAILAIGIRYGMRSDEFAFYLQLIGR